MDDVPLVELVERLGKIAGKSPLQEIARAVFQLTKRHRTKTHAPKASAHPSGAPLVCPRAPDEVSSPAIS